MTKHTTTRPIDLGALAVELGGASLSMADDGETRVITCHDDAITQAQLEAAVEAHVPPPPPMSDADRARFLQAQIDDLTDLLLEVL